MRTRLQRMVLPALVVGCFFVTGLVSVALAGPGAGGTGPGGGCPAATATSPGCVTLNQVTSEPSYTATGVAPQWICSLATATCEMDSPTNDATTSTTVGAITLKATVDIANADLLFDIQDSAGAHVFSCTEAGTCTALLKLASLGGINMAASSFFDMNGGTLTGAYMQGGVTQIDMGVSGSGEVSLTATAFSPASASGNALGTAALPWTDLFGDASMRGSCTFNGATPATCTATVTASAFCVCAPVGATAVIAAGGCAVGLSGTTLTITGPATAAYAVNYTCIL